MSTEARSTKADLGPGTKILRALKYGMLMWGLVDRLHRKCGILIFPYRLYVCGRDLERLSPDAGLVVTELTSEDMREAGSTLAKSDHGRALLEQRARLETERCFGGFVGGKLVCYVWMNTRHCMLPRVSAPLSELPPNEAYSAYMFVFDEFRGRRLAERMGQAVRDRLSAEGYERYYRIVSSFNRATIRVAERQSVALVERRIVLGVPRWGVLDLRIGRQRAPAPTPAWLTARDRPERGTGRQETDRSRQ